MRDPLDASAVYRNKVALTVLPRRRIEHMTDAAQVSFTLLADITDGDDWTLEAHRCLARNTQHPKQGHYSRTVV